MGSKLLLIHFSLSFFTLLLLLLLLLGLGLESSHSLPLSTISRWVVNEEGQRVKLACVNWVAHLEVVVAEGLSHQPVDVLARKINRLGFNCVRLTWPSDLATNHSLASLTVRQSFIYAGLIDTISSLQAHNPSIIDLSLRDAFQAVVKSLTRNKVMVILDNHISKPGWCCGHMADGNGFFGDRYFDADLWIDGLVRMTILFRDNPYVVGMSLRNELHGSRQNVKDWYRWMRRGAHAVHKANPEILVILSGLRYDKDFSFLHKQPLSLSFPRKLVFEIHWYSFSSELAWKTGNSNDVCGRVVKDIMRMAGFLLDQGYPLFVSEWGIDLRGNNVKDNRYINCFLAWMAAKDLDWALWTIVGSYYMRQGVTDVTENYGLLDSNWASVCNENFLKKIALLKYPLRGPGISVRHMYKFIFHPSSGLCIQKKLYTARGLRLGPCSTSNHWAYTRHKFLTIKGSHLCLKARSVDRRARLTFECLGIGTRWELISDSKLHLSTSLKKGSRVCLDIGSNNKVVTTKCKCLRYDLDCNPESQWFKIIDATDIMTTNSSSHSPPQAM